MATAFRFRPLNSERQEIRLVDRAPDSTPSHIRLTTHHTALEDNPRYNALSYTWGAPYEGLPPEWSDPNSTRTISLDGQDFEVRWNLYAALEVLCTGSKDFALMWIDAISIDQSNIPERNSQVSLMGEIYKRAKVTFVWLGPESEKLAGAMDTIRIYAQPHNNQFERFRLLASPENLRGLAQLLDCSWFCRTWVVQEVALSKTVILLTGNTSHVAWEELESVVLLFQQHFDRFATAYKVQANEWLLMQSLGQVLKSATYFRRSEGLRFTLRENSGLNLRVALGTLQPFMASDARDKVYGALGMLSNCEFIKVDYKSSASDVFIATTQGWLENTGDLTILGICQPSERPDFPSWAVDFSAGTNSDPLGSFFLLHPSVMFYSAGGTGPANLRFENSKELIINGIQLGVLSFIGRKEAWYRWCGTCPPDMETAGDPYQRPGEKYRFRTLQQIWLGEWSSFEAQTGTMGDSLEKYLWTQDTTLEAFARTLCADVEVHIGFAQRLKKELNWPQNGPTISELSSLSGNLVRHVFATTSMRHFCLVRDDVQTNDVVVLATGAETPYVLRPIGDGTYLFKGFCYVHGFMDGQALRSMESFPADEKSASVEFRIV